MSTQSHAGALEAIDRILNRESEADEVLRQTVAVLSQRIEAIAWAGILFREGDELVLGPSAGSAPEGGERLEVPIEYGRKAIAALRVAGAEPGAFTPDDRSFLERVALLVSAHCLVGWDTGGVPWSELG